MLTNMFESKKPDQCYKYEQAFTCSIIPYTHSVNGVASLEKLAGYNLGMVLLMMEYVTMKAHDMAIYKMHQ